MVRTCLLLLLVWSAWLQPGWCRPSPPATIPAPSALCRSAILQAERASHVPDRLLDAIAVVESGRRDPVSGAVYPWPWTINEEGIGHFYESKAEAIEAVKAFQAAGVRSIDVGCMQVSLLYHANAFANLDQAFDPVTNAAYGARFLVQLFDQTNAWPLAAAAYHSLTPDIGADYARRVLTAWGIPQLPVTSQTVTTKQDAPVHVATTAGFGFAPFQPSPPVTSLPVTGLPDTARPVTVLPSGHEAVHMLPTPGVSRAPGLSGRGLDTYRAMPIALALRPPHAS